MQNQTHFLVWIDHQVAKIFRFDPATNESSQVHSTHPHQHLHHKANSGDSGHAAVDKQFLEAVAHTLAGAGPILITGPSSAKLELQSHLQGHHREVAARVAAVKPLDHPTDGELLAFGRRYFNADDRMHAQPAP